MLPSCYHHHSEQKACLLFRMKLRISDLKISTKNSSIVYFEASFGNKVVGSRVINVGRHSGDSFERLEVPIKVCFDKRTEHFASEKVTVSVFKHFQTYSKKVGLVVVSPAEMLNDQRKSMAKVFRLERCVERDSSFKLVVDLELTGTLDWDAQANPLDDSCLSVKSQPNPANNLPVIDSTKFDFLKRSSKCDITSAEAQSE